VLRDHTRSVRAAARIAIIEDDDAIRTVLEDVLEDEGYTCLARTSADSGLELLERQRPDLVILDIVLGGRPAGLMLLDQLGQDSFNAAIPVIVCTADNSALVTDLMVLRERGIYCLAKPFDVQELLHLIKNALDHQLMLSKGRATRQVAS